VVVKDGILFVAELALLEDAFVELLEVVLGEAVVLEELLDLIVDVLGEGGPLVAVLDLELVDQQPLQLLPLLNVQQLLPARVALARFGCRRPVLARHTNC